MRKIIISITLLLIGYISNAIETRIIVRVKAKDGKFIGSSLGGAYVIIRNKVNQQILAEGKTTGTTGNSEIILKEIRQRYDPYADDGAAKFSASINIDDPTFVTIEVITPYSHKQSQVRALTEMWLIPGKHIIDDGVIMEVSGYIIDILSPRTHNYILLKSINDKPFKIQANIVLMCGCIITKGGYWNGEEMEVIAIVKKDGIEIKRVDMQIISANLFEGFLDIKDKGDYEFTVYAYNQKTGNTGVDKVNFVIY